MKTVMPCQKLCSRLSRRLGHLRRAPQARLAFLTIIAALVLGAHAPSPDPAFLQPVGSWPGYTRGPAWDVALADQYAYVAIGEGGLMIVDLSDATKPVRMGGYPAAGVTRHVRVVGSRAYLGTMVHRGGGCQSEGWRGHLVILDVSNPRQPVPLGDYVTGSAIQSLEVDGNLVYLGDAEPDGHSEASLRILDVNNPARPVTLSVQQDSGAEALWVGGGRVAVASGSDLRLLDVSQPASPIIRASVEPQLGWGGVRDLAAAGGLLYVVGGEGGEPNAGRLLIYDAGNLAAPEQVGWLDFSATPLAVQIAGDYAYLALGSAGLEVIAVNDPRKPVRVGTCDTPGAAVRVEVAGDHALVADYHGGLQVIDIRDPRHPLPVASFDTGLTAREVRLSGAKACLLSADAYPSFPEGEAARSRVEILDVGDPTRPRLLGACDSGRVIGSMDMVGDLAYAGWMADSNRGLQILDLHDPSRPVWLGDVAVGPVESSAIGVAGGRHYAYVTTPGGGLRVFEVSNPEAPVPLSEPNGAYGGAEVRVLGDYAYVQAECRLEILAITHPEKPVHAGGVDLPGCARGSDGLCVTDGYAGVGMSWGGFSLVDVRRPEEPVVAGTFDTVGEVQDLWIEGAHAYVAEGWQGLEVFEVSDPAHPRPLGRWNTQGQARGVRLSGGYAWVVGGGAGLAILGLPRAGLTIVGEPEGLSVAQGDTATLTVRAFGRDTIRYQWYRGERGDTAHPIAGATGPTYTTLPLSEAAAYWVRVMSGGEASDSRAAHLRLVPPVSVELLGLWPGWRRGPAMDVQVDGDLAYVAAGLAGLIIYDLADPSAPRRLGGWDAEGSASGLTVSGHLAFLATGDRGLRLIDVSNPAAPLEIGSFESDGYATQVVVAGSHAYLAGDQLRIIEVSDPNHPRLVGSHELPGNNLAVSGRYVFVAGSRWDEATRTEHGVLTIVDAADPAVPRQVGSHETLGRANAVAVVGDYAYLAIGSWGELTGGLEIINVSDPTQPHLVGRFAKEASRDVAVSGTTAYLAGSPVSLQLVDVSNPSAPRLAGQFGIGTHTYVLSVATSGRRACLAAGDLGTYVLDLSAPGFPRLAGVADIGGFGEDVAVFGGQAFLAFGDGGLRIIDVRDPGAPRELGAYRANARRVAVSGQYAYLQADTLQVLDVGDPTRPTRVATVEGGGEGVFLTGDTVYLASPAFARLDLSNAATPRVVFDAHPISSAWTVQAIAGLGPCVAVAQDWGGLQLLDLSEPTSPRWRGACYVDSKATGVAVYGRIACVALGPDLPGLEIVDLADPERPVSVARVFLPVVNRVATMGSYACVTGEALTVFDVGDPRQPVRVGGHQLGAETRGLQVVGNLAYVAAGDHGLAIYRLRPELRLDPPVIGDGWLRLSWLGAPGIRLQRATSLAERAWQDVPDSEGANHRTLPPTNAAGFFRLTRP